jgi:hypothetical protein
MVTRGVEGAYQGALRAFQNPMLALLHQTHAPFVVTVLAMVFTAARPRVAVADTHAEINDALEQLRAAGYGDEANQPLPAGNARDLCRQWVQAGWLVRQVSGYTGCPRTESLRLRSPGGSAGCAPGCRSPGSGRCWRRSSDLRRTPIRT